MAKRKKARSLALARRPKKPLARQAEVLPAEPGNGGGYVVAADGSLQLGALGLVELKLTTHEETVLAEHVNPDDVEWKPRVKDGPPEIPYLPHPVYTKWFNRAFGRTGWNLVPVGKPVKTEQNVVLIPYVLHVHGKPIAFAWGEQEYFPENRHQTYGDVVESTVGSALRRAAKHLGVGLEMWDKSWLKKLHRPTDPPARKRNGNGKKAAPVEHAGLDERISDDKRLRLWNISRRCGRGDTEVSEWLKVRYNLKASADITNRHYDDIVTFIERPGPLPMHEPGKDQ